MQLRFADLRESSAENSPNYNPHLFSKSGSGCLNFRRPGGTGRFRSLSRTQRKTLPKP